MSDHFSDPMTPTVAIEQIDIAIADLLNVRAALEDRAGDGRTDTLPFIISSLEAVDAGINPA